MRYAGQQHSLTVPVKLRERKLLADMDALGSAFSEAYRRSFGGALGLPIEITAVRAARRRPLPRRKLEAMPATRSAARPESRVAHSFTRRQDLPFDLFERDALPIGTRFHGPAIVCEATATTYVDAGYGFEADAKGCLRLMREDN